MGWCVPVNYVVLFFFVFMIAAAAAVVALRKRNIAAAAAAADVALTKHDQFHAEQVTTAETFV